MLDQSIVVLDPIGSLIQAGTVRDAHFMLIRLIDFLKVRGITALLTNLTHGGSALENTSVNVSSIVDAWLLVRDIEVGGERNRALYVLKSRGMAHSNQLREFRITGKGIQLLDVYVGPEGVLTGSARLAQESREKSAGLAQQQELEAKQRALQRKRLALEAHISALRKEFEAEKEEAQHLHSQELERENVLASNRAVMARSRHADLSSASNRLRKIASESA